MLEIRLCRSTIMKLFHVVQGCHGHSVAHIKYIPVTLSRTPPLLLMTQPLRLFRRPPWRLEWYKTHSGPVTQNCKDKSIFFFCGSALELSLTVWLQTIELQSYPWEYWCCQRGGWSVFISLMEVTVQRLKTLYSEWTLPLGEVWHHKKQKNKPSFWSRLHLNHKEVDARPKKIEREFAERESLNLFTKRRVGLQNVVETRQLVSIDWLGKQSDTKIKRGQRIFQACPSGIC